MLRSMCELSDAESARPTSIRIWWPRESRYSSADRPLTGWAWERRGQGRYELVVKSSAAPGRAQGRRSVSADDPVPAGASVLCTEGPVGKVGEATSGADLPVPASDGRSAPLIWAVFMHPATLGGQPRLIALHVHGRAVSLPKCVVLVTYEVLSPAPPCSSVPLRTSMLSLFPGAPSQTALTCTVCRVQTGKKISVDDASSCFRALTCIGKGFCPKGWEDASPEQAAAGQPASRAPALPTLASLRRPVWATRLWFQTAAARANMGQAAVRKPLCSPPPSTPPSLLRCIVLTLLLCSSASSTDHARVHGGRAGASDGGGRRARARCRLGPPLEAGRRVSGGGDGGAAPAPRLACPRVRRTPSGRAPPQARCPIILYSLQR